MEFVRTVRIAYSHFSFSLKMKKKHLFFIFTENGKVINGLTLTELPLFKDVIIDLR